MLKKELQEMQEMQPHNLHIAIDIFGIIIHILRVGRYNMNIHLKDTIRLQRHFREGLFKTKKSKIKWIISTTIL